MVLDSSLYFIQTAILGIIEGISEFMPISSTAHLIFFGNLMGFTSEKSRIFEVFIQSGAVLALVIFFRRKLSNLFFGVVNFDKTQLLLFRNLIVSILPSIIVGFFFVKTIKQIFDYYIIISMSLILGGFILLIVEYKYNNFKERRNLNEISFTQALFIGLLQCLAMIPGVSRSGATIVAGIVVGLDRRSATEFSFMMAIPTMLGAAIYDLYSNFKVLSNNDILGISIGFLCAFFSAILVIECVMNFISNNTYKIFALYRIFFGGVMFLLYFNWH
ncbi:undecaprenyl-diphosphatase [Candidatus Kinetoplastibacterium desouzaii TCC079E]|uniref:Undecaprenyl-diphosphatase n=1 Tax=Candidatus Kinetoplastidibacterium desouzai TCC079E TaxID=1208919 RepID=M1LRD4_9PROT|nr:undecaprenyl-diphosphate phosphatase [Candidatus Kinetoplastibacterium desouzaii]AGF46716.1 undecaprenyl-diphosphatase [Candidatus Kinetoplastibacterium desouzaii TCC079E]